jgi:hypothetical protein
MSAIWTRRRNRGSQPSRDLGRLFQAGQRPVFDRLQRGGPAGIFTEITREGMKLEPHASLRACVRVCPQGKRRASGSSRVYTNCLLEQDSAE